MLLEWLQRSKPHLLSLAPLPRPVRWAAYSGLIWLMLYCQTSQPAPFIYFQF